MWPSMTSAIRLLMAPRQAAMVRRIVEQSCSWSSAFSTASIWPRMRRTRLSSFFLSRMVWAIGCGSRARTSNKFIIQYPRRVYARPMLPYNTPRRNQPMTTVPDRSTFESAYTGQAPWDIGRPQKAFLDVANRITGSVPDAGCGTGDNALFFASRGHKVTGIDFLEEPITRARRKATERGLTATFFVMDALALKDLPEVFDSVIDSGLFHVFSDEDRRRYAAGLATVLKPGGRPVLRAFTDDEPAELRRWRG